MLGAGAIGAYVGIRLSSVGLPVTLVGRRALLDARPLSAQGLKGPPSTPRDDLRVETEVEALAEADLVLLATKSRDTEDAARALAEVARAGTPVVSLQNGLFNPERIRRGAPNLQAVAGLVTFNVVREGERFRQGTSGPVLVGRGEGPARAHVRALVEGLEAAGEQAQARPDIEAVQASKLLLNLNNGICAATGLPVRGSLLDRRLRRVLAAAITEGRRVLHASGRRERAIGVLSPALIAKLLPLPDAIFERLARRMLTIDPSARSSTLQDLDRGRATEIEDLNGAIVSLAQRSGVEAPVNAAITAHVHRLEREQPDLRFVDPGALAAEVGVRT